MQLSRLNLCHSETSFVKFPFSIWHKYQNERTSKSLDGKIKESHQRGLPLTTQQLQQTQKDERLSSALIAPDETVWLKAAQIGGHMCVSVSQAAATATAAATSLFWICETSLFSRKKHMTDEAQLWEEKWGVWIQGFLERNKNNLIWNKFNNSLQVILDAYLLSRYIAFVTAEGLIRAVITLQFEAIKCQSEQVSCLALRTEVFQLYVMVFSHKVSIWRLPNALQCDSREPSWRMQ